MTLAVKTVQVPSQHARALTELQTVNKETRSIEVVWTTGARGLRYGWEGPYYEELSLDPSHLRLGRLKSGASVIDSHDRSSGLSAVLGVVKDAWIVSANEARAILELSDDPAKAGVVNDILNGKIRNVSVGYSIYKMVEVGREGDIPVLRAEDWEPSEISFVAVPFDSGSTSRSGDEALNNCEVSTTQRAKKMDPIELAKLEAERAAKEAEHTRALAAEGQRAVEADRKRAADIIAAVEKAGLERSFADGMVLGGKTIDQAREMIIDQMAEKNRASAISPITAGGLDEKTTNVRAMTEYMATRIAPSINQPTELSQRFRSATLLDLCKDTLRMSGVRFDSWSKSEIVQRALHTTSDFSNIITSSTQATLTTYYKGNPPDWNFLTRDQPMADYKALKRVSLGDGPQLLEIKEHGEYKSGTISDTAESLSLKKYGRKFGITREAIINDDLSALQDIPRIWTNASNNLISNLIVGQFVGNPTMGDGLPLFHANHGNLAASGTALDVVNLAMAVAALEKQKGPANADSDSNFLRLKARYLIVSPDLKLAATQLTTSINPVTFQTVNPFAYLEVKSDPSLSGNAWYVAADNSLVDTIALMYLQGEQGPQIFQKEGFDVDGIEYKIRQDTGAKALGWNWIYKNPGL